MGSFLDKGQGKIEGGVSAGFHSGSVPTSISSVPSAKDSCGTGMWSRGLGKGGKGEVFCTCTSLEALVEVEASVHWSPEGVFSDEAIAEAMAEAVAVTFMVGVSIIVIDCESD